MDVDLSVDIYVKLWFMSMDIDVKFHIHGNPENYHFSKSCKCENFGKAKGYVYVVHRRKLL